MILKYGKGSIIGAYECTFNKRSLYKYKVIKSVEGYFIRKSKWLQIMNEHDNVFRMFTVNFLKKYMKFKKRIDTAKHEMILKLQERADVNAICTLQNA